jgi:dihydroflavonol-4-reductase
MKAFVTGGTGFIGSHLIDLLLKQKEAEIFALVRDLSKQKWLNGLPLHLLQGDLSSIPPLPRDLDVVFHLAGLTKSSKSADYYTVNQKGTTSLFESLMGQEIRAKIIFLSSLAAVGPSVGGKLVQEDNSPHPLTSYGKSKLAGEEEALKFKGRFPLVILRAAAIYGPRDTDFLQYFKFIKKGILGSYTSKPKWVSLCYVKDLAQALHLSASRNLESGEIFNIADKTPYSWEEIGRAAGRALGKKLKKVTIPAPLFYLGALFSEIAGKISKKPNIFNRDKYRDMRQEGWMADVQKAKEKLSFETQYSLEEAIQETIDWYLKNEWL